jgi:hypothetical protein
MKVPFARDKRWRSFVWLVLLRVASIGSCGWLCFSWLALLFVAGFASRRWHYFAPIPHGYWYWSGSRSGLQVPDEVIPT